MNESDGQNQVAPEADQLGGAKLRTFTGEAKKVSRIYQLLTQWYVAVLLLIAIGCGLYYIVINTQIFKSPTPPISPASSAKQDEKTKPEIQTEQVIDEKIKPEIQTEQVIDEKIKPEIQTEQAIDENTKPEIQTEHAIDDATKLKIASLDQRITKLENNQDRIKMPYSGTIKNNKVVATEYVELEIIEAGEKSIRLRYNGSLMNFAIGTSLPGGALFLGYDKQTRTVRTTRGDFIVN